MTMIFIPSSRPSGPSKSELLEDQREAIIERLLEENPDDEKRVREIDIQLDKLNGDVPAFLTALIILLVVAAFWFVVTMANNLFFKDFACF